MHVGASSDGIPYSLLLGTLQCVYTVHIPYGGNNLREKTLANWPENTIFAEKTFADCLPVLPTNAMLPNFVKKTFMNSHKTSKFTKVFSHKFSAIQYISC